VDSTSGKVLAAQDIGVDSFLSFLVGESWGLRSGRADKRLRGMMSGRTALIVSRNAAQQLDSWLRASGYDTTLVCEFDLARRCLERDPPNLLVSDVKLGAYNGLHLAIWAQGRSLNTRTILIGDVDPVLQLEATRAGAAYLLQPVDEASFIGVLATMFTYAPARRSPRKRVVLDVIVDGLMASVIDLSYQGLRLELQEATAHSMPPFLTITIPSHDISCRVQRVWQERVEEPPGALWCGVTLPDPATPSAVKWRALVDSMCIFNSAHSTAALVDGLTPR
jgi:CheY-like chemotaxis protein